MITPGTSSPAASTPLLEIRNLTKRFAVRGGELAGVAALDALEHGWQGVHQRLAARRRAEFASKWRFNRLLLLVNVV